MIDKDHNNTNQMIMSNKYIFSKSPEMKWVEMIFPIILMRSNITSTHHFTVILSPIFFIKGSCCEL